jgi:ABC-2 type transport system ATP-binding protein
MPETLNEAIQVKRLTKRYGSLSALNEVSFEVRQGEIFGFLGPNGAGKTTTIHILTTLLKPSSGSAAILGVDVINNPHQARRTMSIMFQADCLDPFLNVYDHIYFYSLLEGTPRAQRRKRIERTMEILNLSSKAKASVFQLSGGLLRRLQLARILFSEAKVLFLDEPTLGIDIEGKINIWTLLKNRCEAGNLTIFLATNDMAEAEFLCDRIAFISEGKLLALDTAEALKKQTKKTVLSLEVERGAVEGLSLNLPPGASLLSTGDARVEIELARLQSDLPAIIRQIGEQTAIKDIEIRKPTVQDVFLHLFQKRGGD